MCVWQYLSNWKVQVASQNTEGGRLPDPPPTFLFSQGQWAMRVSARVKRAGRETASQQHLVTRRPLRRRRRALRIRDTVGEIGKQYGARSGRDRAQIETHIRGQVSETFPPVAEAARLLSDQWNGVVARLSRSFIPRSHSHWDGDTLSPPLSHIPVIMGERLLLTRATLWKRHSFPDSGRTWGVSSRSAKKMSVFCKYVSTSDLYFHQWQCS